MDDYLDDAVALAVEALARAPFDPNLWEDALRHLANATESRHGQLAGWMPANRLPFQLMTDEPDGLICPARPIIGGDGLSMSIAAASIVAKVARDRLMARLDPHYPGYGFSRHAGYATRDHRDALARLGPTPLHRRSFNSKACAVS